MQNKILWPFLFTVCLSACDGSRTFTLDPVARKQLYTLEIDGGERQICGVDTHPIDPVPVLGLGAQNIQVGYKSYDNGGHAFCEIERGYEYHGELFFDLAPLGVAGVSEINTLTLTGQLRRDHENTCLRSDDPSSPIFAVELVRPAEAFTNDESENVYPLQALGRRVDDTEWDYRDWVTSGVDDVDETVGVNRLTAAMGVSVIDSFESELSVASPDWSGFSVVAKANPDWRGQRTCLARLVDVQLIVVAPE